MPTKIAIIGAAGAMGTRASKTLSHYPERFEVMHVEATGAGVARLRERDIMPMSLENAVSIADATIMAIPDNVIGKVSTAIVPQLKSGSLLMCPRSGGTLRREYSGARGHRAVRSAPVAPARLQ